ncbi:MAG: ABC-F family ATP-binding cassette domain-containing protein [Verrucomicrobiia bacterium]
MLSISGVAKSFAGRTLFEDVSLQVNRGDRIGLVGPNGAGKSTLLSLILQRESPDAGSITLQRGTSLGYLPQETVPPVDETVLQLATAGASATSAHDGAIQPGVGSGAVMAGIDHDLDGFEHEPRAKKVLRGLGFRETDYDRPCTQLSGGWIMRAHLARLLVREPDLLMLDEPTNHLDLEALLWLQGFLKNYPGAVLIISHDRAFLNELAGAIVEIRQGRLWRYRGNYDEYLEQRAAQEEQWTAAYRNQQREIAQLMRFVERFRAKNTKASQAQSKLKQIERMEKIEAPVAEEAEIDFRFPQPVRSGLRVIALKDVDQSYGDVAVYRRLHFHAERGQRTVLVGPNGAGKSTLLKLLAGVVEFQAGERVLGHNVRLGYFAQHRVENLHVERTVLDEALDTPQQVTEQFVRTVLGCFLFRGDDVFKRVGVLSGGEKTRLALVKLLLDPPNLLLMDEPTTHLDMASIEALIGALEQFQGTLIFISHDVYFIRAIANHVVHVNAGHLRHYPGGYQYYLDKTEALRALAEQSAASDSARSQKPAADRPVDRLREQKRLEAQQRQVRYRQRKAQETEVKRLEREIEALEKRQSELTAALEDSATYETPGRAAEITRELPQVVERLKVLTPEWEAAASKLLELEL